MKKHILFVSAPVLLMLFMQTTTAGNKDRAGQAGALELNINPWSCSSGWAGANTACVHGLEAMYGNIAGTAFTKKTELVFSRANWLVGSDIFINSFGFTQKAGESGAIGLGIMSMRFGDINTTTTENPEGGIGKFSPQFLNVNLSYAKGFSDHIFGGINVKAITEQISNLSAKGVALDAGIQYISGSNNQLKFGIALRNIGPKLTYKGDGLSIRTPLPNGFASSNGIAVEQKSASFELPSLVNIGASYDFYFTPDSAAIKNHRLTVAGNFTSNSFGKDEFRLGAEYGWKSLLMLRAGYNFEPGMFVAETKTTAYIGPCAGFSVQSPFKKGGLSTFALDYSYRFSNPFQGTHTIGVRVSL